MNIGAILLDSGVRRNDAAGFKTQFCRLPRRSSQSEDWPAKDRPA